SSKLFNISLPFGERGPVIEDMKPTLIGRFCAWAGGVPEIAASTKATTTTNPLRIQILPSLFFRRWMIMTQSSEPLQSSQDSGQILRAASRYCGGRGQLLRNTSQQQRHSKTLALFQHKLKVLQEQINFHLWIEAMAHHERAAH